MFNTAQIMRDAWRRYRELAQARFVRRFDRKLFATALRLAWSYAKVVANAPPRPSKPPLPVAAQNELFLLNMKNRWTDADHRRADELRHAA